MGFRKSFVFQNDPGDHRENGGALKRAKKVSANESNLVREAAPHFGRNFAKKLPPPTASMWRLKVSRNWDHYFNGKTKVFWHKINRRRSAALTPGRWNIERRLPIGGP